MGTGSWTSRDWAAYSSQHIAGKSATGIYYTNYMKDDFDPRFISLRESCDGPDHPESNAIIIGLDVTGSMNNILESVAKKLGVLVGEILDRKPVRDPQVMFAAIGDGIWDNCPLQVTQFESDIRIAEQLKELYFERGGAGNGFESYPLLWYFAARKTKIDCLEKRNKKGFLFTMGDDCYPTVLTNGELYRIFGDEIESDTIPVEQILTEVNRKYEVFHLILDRGGYDTSDKASWIDLLGERAITVTDHTKIPEVIVSILETMSGKDKDSVINSWDGSTSLVVAEAIGNLQTTSKSNNVVIF